MKKLLLLGILTLIARNGNAQNTNPAPQPFVLGSIHQLHSAILSETRTLNIYLPEGYSPDSDARYPVIYLLDGSADEDFIHIAGLVQYANFPWVKLFPKSILVGIANVNRERDYTYPASIPLDKKRFPVTGGSENFISFIENELQPFMDRNFKTNSGKMLIGQSLGGLLATEILFKKPNLFDQYLIVSPSLWWDNESLLKVKPAALKTGTRVYIAVGKEGKVMENDARRLFRQLKDSSPKLHQLDFEYFPKEDHATIFHLAVYDAFGKFTKG